jgi:hypothetical protein
MKYLVTTTPRPMPPPPEVFDAAMQWIEDKVDDGTFDCVYGFLDGGGFSVTNTESHSEAFELMTEYPMFGFVDWEIRPLMAFGENQDRIRGKLEEAQAAIAG